eukprot:21534-Heterococcus_DN1.PRE.1
MSRPVVYGLLQQQYVAAASSSNSSSNSVAFTPPLPSLKCLHRTAIAVVGVVVLFTVPQENDAHHDAYMYTLLLL